MNTSMYLAYIASTADNLVNQLAMLLTWGGGY